MTSLLPLWGGAGANCRALQAPSPPSLRGKGVKTTPIESHGNRNPPIHRDTPKPQGERRGLVLVHTGTGKKSTAAFGLALRAHGRGKAVKVYQFMKVPSARFGEHRLFEQLGIPIEGLGDGFSWKSRDLDHSAQLAKGRLGPAEASDPRGRAVHGGARRNHVPAALWLDRAR